MIRSKAALISSFVILCVCIFLSFPFPNNRMLDARATFMSFPIKNQDGYITVGIFGSVLFVIAIILLFIGVKQYHFRILLIVLIAFALVPNQLITLYQETFASGISAISYDGKGQCDFENVSEDKLTGECNFVLHNRSNEAVSFELQFLDSFFMDDGIRMESLMNVAGPHTITIEANHKKSIHMKELLNLTNVPNHVESGSSSNIHFKLIEGKASRTL
ncbi:hypothetical protein CSE16_13950 [Solibacillus sp. R5-41]|uniref:hypothetical protein n=1 Tax=Solibacillus sp. R5-41 TaxID=2048654 RepID=UPI000C126B29|nr:hypothetical protein [Solibacillus sp. R5-41]ATP41065.1 hypothetical protein CSE16_13950 [Solibacillus sp. R5-41]